MKQHTLVQYTDNWYIHYIYLDFTIHRIIKYEKLKTKELYKVIFDVDKYKNFEIINDKMDFEKVEIPDEIQKQNNFLYKMDFITQ